MSFYVLLLLFRTSYGRPAGRQAYLDIVERAVLNGSADGIYAGLAVLRYSEQRPS